VRRNVPPSAEIEDQIDQLLAVGVGVNGHRFLPTGGHRFSPVAAMFSPHWWPPSSPRWCGGSRGLDGAKAVGRSGIESPRRVQLSRGSTPSPAVAWASR
jgi:hypothetical protein